MDTMNRIKGRPTDPSVTLTTPDPAAPGKLATATFPRYFTDAACKAQWKKLFDALHERMRKRGLEQAMMLGWLTDYRARKEEFAYWKDVSGDLPWVSHSHFKLSKSIGVKPGYVSVVHDAEEPLDPAKGHKYGWQRPELIVQQLLRPGCRGEMDTIPSSMWNCMTEVTMTGGQRGFGRLGGDTWKVLKDKQGRRKGRVYDRYPWTNWNCLELCSSVFAPGPDGPVATAHFEQFREGVETCEARVYIEQALADKAKCAKLGEELARRCQSALDDRLLFGLRGMCNYTTGLHGYISPWEWKFQSGEAGHAWYQSSGWQVRNARSSPWPAKWNTN